jgi:uncharacterized protein (DUF924 family)
MDAEIDIFIEFRFGSSRWALRHWRSLILRSKRAGTEKFTEAEQIFFYLPHEHSDGLKVQKHSVELFSQVVDWDQEFATAHFHLIERFGHFPHRNAALGRKNTLEED